MKGSGLNTIGGTAHCSAGCSKRVSGRPRASGRPAADGLSYTRTVDVTSRILLVPKGGFARAPLRHAWPCTELSWILLDASSTSASQVVDTELHGFSLFEIGCTPDLLPAEPPGIHVGIFRPARIP